MSTNASSGFLKDERLGLQKNDKTQRQKTWIGENDKRRKNKECRKMTKDKDKTGE